jgi:hypothetical protein
MQGDPAVQLLVCGVESPEGSSSCDRVFPLLSLPPGDAEGGLDKYQGRAQKQLFGSAGESV